MSEYRITVEYRIAVESAWASLLWVFWSPLPPPLPPGGPFAVECMCTNLRRYHIVDGVDMPVGVQEERSARWLPHRELLCAAQSDRFPGQNLERGTCEVRAQRTSRESCGEVGWHCNRALGTRVCCVKINTRTPLGPPLTDPFVCKGMQHQSFLPSRPFRV